MCYSRIECLPDNLIVNGNLDLSFCKSFKKLPNNLKVSERLNIEYSLIKELPEDFKCREIEIDSEQMKMIKEKMVFDIIYVGVNSYTKKEFFERFGQKTKNNYADIF